MSFIKLDPELVDGDIGPPEFVAKADEEDFDEHCPKCGAQPGELCRNRLNGTMGLEYVHSDRRTVNDIPF